MDTKFQLFPDSASTMAPRVDALFGFVFSVAAFFIVLIAVLLFYFAIRYRRRSEDYFPKPVIGSKVLETVWTVGPLGLTVIMFVWGARLYFDIVRTPDNGLEVYVTGKQWMWQLQHPTGQREINQLHVPVGVPIKLIMTSEDVIHDFYVPAFRIKQDVIPGRYTYLWFEATTPGTYHLFCAAYCGTNHSRMIGSVVVLEQPEYEKWLASNKADRSLALQGRQLFQKFGCVTCHHAEAGGRAPILEAIYDREVDLQDGRRVRANEAYLRESILYPNAKIRAGYRSPSIMPPYDGQVSEDDLIRLIAFLKALKPGETPPRVENAAPPARDAKLGAKKK